MGTATTSASSKDFKIWVEAHSKIDGDCDSTESNNIVRLRRLKRIPKLMGTATVCDFSHTKSPCVEAHSKIDGDCDFIPI